MDTARMPTWSSSKASIRAFVGLLGVVGFFALAPVSLADWSAPVDLSSVGQDAENAQVVVDRSGVATAIWNQGTAIQSTSRPVGGAWSAPADVGSGIAPKIAVDASGATVAVWSKDEGGYAYSVQSAARPAGGVWGAPIQLSANGVNASDLDVALDPQGRATVVWLDQTSADKRPVQWVTRSAAGMWSAPANLTTVDYASLPRVVADAAGTVTAVWRLSGATTQVQSSSRVAEGVWSAPADISGPGAGGADLAIGDSGTVVALWNVGGTRLQSASRSITGTWSAPVELSAQGTLINGAPRIALDAADVATAVWISLSDSDFQVRASSRPPGGAWSTPVTISNDYNIITPDVAVDAAGNATVVWGSDPGSGMQSVTRPAGGAWSTPKTVSAPGNVVSPVVAVSPSGVATTVWEFFGPSGSRIQASYIGSAAPTSPLDSDADGVPDASDDCPQIAGTSANGCLVPPADVDGDGTADTADQCPTIAAATSDGCPPPPAPVPPAPTMVPTPAPPPVATDHIAPAGKLSAARSQRLARPLTVSVMCPDEACRVTTSATIRVPRIGSTKATTYTLKAVKTSLAQARKGKVALTLGASTVKAVRRALKGGRRLTAKVKVVLVDAAGNSSTLRQDVKLTT